jgi:hypothetical protein
MSLAHQSEAGMNSHASTIPQDSAVSCQPELLQCVSEVLPDPIAIQAELDAAIRELGQCAEQAMKDGDKETAREYSSRMYAAIRSRTPEHQARLAAAVDELVFCGDWAMRMARGVR